MSYIDSVRKLQTFQLTVSGHQAMSLFFIQPALKVGAGLPCFGSLWLFPFFSEHGRQEKDRPLKDPSPNLALTRYQKICCSNLVLDTQDWTRRRPAKSRCVGVFRGVSPWHGFASGLGDRI